MSGSPRTGHAPPRLTRRGRAVLISFAAALTLMALWLSGGPGALAGGRDGGREGVPDRRRTVVVGPGDTLWEIASAATPGSDPRRAVQRIIDLNGLGGDPVVRPGQELIVPSR
ncbi:LysM peptidoglycan-binding domain-containing protein [Actinomadura roseirufa]|uniref:LysM peptidoglycan-binding domain-containing protein n=1 Tax=Actinomadura roseirufa TaxID=2094049 RepID=UPI0010415C41|nr:LysM domain-containing protein [Actinomadura roseirufa]